MIYLILFMTSSTLQLSEDSTYLQTKNNHLSSRINSMPFHQPVKSPNLEKLFLYLQKSQWHNVSASFAGFVKKEFETNLDKLEEDDATYRNMKLMVEYSEIGKFSEAKNLVDPAYKEYTEMLNRLTELQLLKAVQLFTF